MLTNVNDIFIAWKGAVSGLYGVGIAFCIFRLVYCWRHKTFEKAFDWAPITFAVFATMEALAIWPVYQQEEVSRDIQNQTMLYWTMLSLWLVLIWLSRATLFLRLASFPSLQRSNRWRLHAALIFLFVAVFFGTLAGMISIGCVHVTRANPNERVKTTAFCDAREPVVAIVHFILSFLSDVTLAVSSGTIYFRPSLSSPQAHRGPLMVFVASLVLLLGTVFYAFVYYASTSTEAASIIAIDMASHLQSTLSIMGALLPAVILEARTKAQEPQTPTITVQLGADPDRKAESGDDHSSISSYRRTDDGAV